MNAILNRPSLPMPSIHLRSSPLPSSQSGRSISGTTLSMVLQAVLLLLVLGQVVFLAGHYRLRVDLTEDGLYSLTDSTRRIIDGLEDRLLIEAYFSPDAELPTAFREPREMLRNLLDEYVQSSRGRIILQYFDPKSDQTLRERATRIGIVPLQTQNAEAGGVSLRELWQGFRLRYGGNRQRVIAQIDFRLASTTAQYERLLTPVIKSLTVVFKPKIGVIAYPSPPADQVGMMNVRDLEIEQDYKVLQEWSQVSDHYNMVKVSITRGQHIPDDLSALLLIRPRDLSDRQKYVIDQYLMKGGKLVIFVDTDDYSLGVQRLMYRRKMVYDDAASRSKFLDQLGHYGLSIGTDIVIDGAPEARVPIALTIQAGRGRRGIPLNYYPYWLRPVDIDWATQAERLAMGPEGEVDQQLEARYRQRFKPGMEERVAKKLGSPELFWPCRVELAEIMPKDVSGAVLMRTSPWAMEKAPKFKIHPASNQEDPRFIAAAINSFATSVMNGLKGEPRHQIGLMAEVHGKFTSFFADQDMPLPEGVYKSEKPMLLSAPENQPEQAEQAEQGLEGPPKAPSGPSPDAALGADEPELIESSPAGTQIVVIGDSDFIRDDVVNDGYRRSGGPTSRYSATLFFANLLDWLAGDQDLFELRSKVANFREIVFLKYDPLTGGTPQEHAERVRNKGFLLRTMVQVTAPILLLLSGLYVLIRRRAAKREFLAGVGS